jgi:hypothetical protein
VKREEVARTIGVGLQLLAKTNHMGDHSAGIGERFVTPYGIQDHVALKRPVGVLKKERHQVVFGRSEADFLVAASDDAAIEIHLDIREGEHFLLPARLAAQRDSDAGEQFARTERFDDVIVGSYFEQKHFVDLFADGADDDDDDGREDARTVFVIRLDAPFRRFRADASSLR